MGYGAAKTKTTITIRGRDIKEVFGWNLNDFLGRKNVSQQDLAKRISVNPCQVTRWVNGHVMPSIDAIAAICTELEILPDHLFRDYRDPVNDRPLERRFRERY